MSRIQQIHTCHICGGEMYPILETKTYCFDGIPVTVDGVKVFRCINCGEGILESEEVKRIEGIVLTKTN